MERSKVLLVGVGGFGAGYVRELLEGAAGQRAQVVGVVDPYAKQSPAYPLLERAGTPIHETVEAFYAQGEAELAVIATPIQFHEHQACFCLRAGSHVLLEKPMAATVEQAKAAFAAGASHVTHLFNAMPPFSHRAPGVVGAALDTPGCMVELICDGIHIHPPAAGSWRWAFSGVTTGRCCA